MAVWLVPLVLYAALSLPSRSGVRSPFTEALATGRLRRWLYVTPFACLSLTTMPVPAASLTTWMSPARTAAARYSSRSHSTPPTRVAVFSPRSEASRTSAAAVKIAESSFAIVYQLLIDMAKELYLDGVGKDKIKFTLNRFFCASFLYISFFAHDLDERKGQV